MGADLSKLLVENTLASDLSKETHGGRSFEELGRVLEDMRGRVVASTKEFGEILSLYSERFPAASDGFWDFLKQGVVSDPEYYRILSNSILEKFGENSYKSLLLFFVAMTKTLPPDIKKWILPDILDHGLVPEFYLAARENKDFHKKFRKIYDREFFYYFLKKSVSVNFNNQTNKDLGIIEFLNIIRDDARSLAFQLLVFSGYLEVFCDCPDVAGMLLGFARDTFPKSRAVLMMEAVAGQGPVPEVAKTLQEALVFLFVRIRDVSVTASVRSDARVILEVNSREDIKKVFLSLHGFFRNICFSSSVKVFLLLKEAFDWGEDARILKAVFLGNSHVKNITRLLDDQDMSGDVISFANRQDVSLVVRCAILRICIQKNSMQLFDVMSKSVDQLMNDYPDDLNALRVAYFMSICYFDSERVEAYFQKAMALRPDSIKIVFQYIGFLKHMRDIRKIYSILNEIRQKCVDDTALLSEFCRTSLQIGFLEGIEPLLQRLEGMNADPRRMKLLWADYFLLCGDSHRAFGALTGVAPTVPSGKLLETLGSVDPRDGAVVSNARVLAQSSEILSKTAQPANPQGVTVLITQSSPLSMIWKTLVATEMRKTGFATVVLEKATGIQMEKTGIEVIDNLNGIVVCRGLSLAGEDFDRPLRHEWHIDLDRKIIAVEGMNLYQSIYERISTKMRRYRVDFNHPFAKSQMADLMMAADVAYGVCKYVHREIASKGIKVRFFGSMSHYVPASVYHRYCVGPGKNSNMEYVSFLAAYEHYYSNMGSLYCTALSMENMTRHPELRMPCHAYPDQFEAWLAKDHDIPAIIREIDQVVRFDRAGVTKSPEAQAVIDRIEAHRRRGGRVICLFGKIMYDICIDEEGGPAHVDMVDWLNHSIEAVRGYDDVLLLVKPHPNEIKKEVANPTEYFMDAIEVDVPNNVILLEHRWLNLADVVPYIDLGVLWHGTSVLELMTKGIPVALCATWGIKDHPIDVVSPRDRADYEEILRHPERFSVTPEQKQRAAMLLKYLSTEEIMVPYNYGRMGVFRDVDKAHLSWYMDKVEAYLENGDPHITAMASRCL